MAEPARQSLRLLLLKIIKTHYYNLPDEMKPVGTCKYAKRSMSENLKPSHAQTPIPPGLTEVDDK